MFWLTMLLMFTLRALMGCRDATAKPLEVRWKPGSVGHQLFEEVNHLFGWFINTPRWFTKQNHDLQTIWLVYKPSIWLV